MRHTIALLATSLIVVACATTDDDTERLRGAEQFADDPRLGEPVDRLCFAARIDSFSQTTRDTIIVREGRDHYLIEVHGACQTLDHAQTVGFDAFGSCLTKGDNLIVSESIAPRRASAFNTDRCLVRGIYEWDPDAAETEDDDDATNDDAIEPETTPETTEA